MKFSIHNLKLTEIFKPCDENCIGVVDDEKIGNRLIREAVNASAKAAEFESQSNSDYLLVRHQVGDIEGYFDGL